MNMNFILTCIASDAYVEHLQEEFKKAEVETAHVANEIELLSKTYKDG